MDTTAPLAKRQKTAMNGNGYGLDVGVNYSEGSVSVLTYVFINVSLSHVVRC